MPSAQIAASHYEPDGPGDGRKLCINAYPEKTTADPARTFRLVPTPGSRLIDDSDTLSTAVRAVAYADGYADGKLVVVDGTTVRLLTTTTETWSTLTGTLAGTDRAQVVFGEVQAGFLGNGLLYQSASAGSSIATLTDADWATLLSDHGQTAFTSIAVLGLRLFATYGSRIAYSTALDFDNTTTLNYYTAEDYPDGIVAGVVLRGIYFVFGTQTIQPFRLSTDNDNPLIPITTEVIDRGTIGRDTIVKLDNTLFFISDTGEPCRLNGLTPMVLNPDDKWVTRLINSVDPSTIICRPIETDAHFRYQINAPTFCIDYDVQFQSWTKRETQGQDTWEWAFMCRKGAVLYAGSRLDTKLAQISKDYLSDDMPDASTFGTEIIHTFTAHAPVKMGRTPISSIRVDGTKGVGLVTGQGSDPLLTMSKSKDKGITYGIERSRSMGKIGEHLKRLIWRLGGRAAPEQVVFKFSWSDPVNFSPTGVVLNEQ